MLESKSVYPISSANYLEINNIVPTVVEQSGMGERAFDFKHKSQS